MHIFKVLLYIFSLVFAGLFVGCMPSKRVSEKGPEITHISWGKVVVKHVDGAEYEYKDCKVYPTGSKEWNWNETGTRHNPGIQPADVKDFIEEVDVVILTRGMELELHIKQETLDYLVSLGKTYYMEQTEIGVAHYNRLNNEGKKVGILIHSTC